MAVFTTLTPAAALENIVVLDIAYCQIGDYKCFKVEETNEVYFISEQEVLIAEDPFL